MIGDGFVTDVLGADATGLADPAFDTLSFAGLGAEEIVAAQSFVFGQPSLTQRPSSQATIERRLRGTWMFRWPTVWP